MRPHRLRSRRFSPSTVMLRALFYPIVVLASLPGSAQQGTWYLLSRENGCVSLEILVEMERLPRAPTSPDDYARMQLERGKKVSLELPDGFPPEFRGKVVQVKTAGDEGGPVFVTDEVCRKIGRPGHP